MNNAVQTFALWGGAIITFSGLVYGGFKFYRWFDRLSRLMQHELNHNSGSSIKDHARKAADESVITNVMLQELVKDVRSVKKQVGENANDQFAWNEATERELDRVWSMIRKTHEQPPSGER